MATTGKVMATTGKVMAKHALQTALAKNAFLQHTPTRPAFGRGRLHKPGSTLQYYSYQPYSALTRNPLAVAVRIRQVLQLVSNVGLPPPVLELAKAGQVRDLAQVDAELQQLAVGGSGAVRVPATMTGPTESWFLQKRSHADSAHDLAQVRWVRCTRHTWLVATELGMSQAHGERHYDQEQLLSQLSPV